MPKPLLSVVIANFNYGRFLEEAILSVLNQGRSDLVELIICDAASTDDSIDIIKKYSSKIAWWCSEPDGGQSEAFNKGFSHARGRFLTWLNADDLLLPGTVSRLAHQAKIHPECEWFVGGSIWCDRHLFVQKLFRPHRFSVRRLRERQLMVGGPSSFFTKNIYERAGKIDETLHYTMDTDLWQRFAAKCGQRYRSLGIYTWVFRFHEESKTNGRMVQPQSECARKNAEAFAAESELLRRKYGIARGIYRYTRKIPVSIFDAARAKFDAIRWRGRHINEVRSASLGGMNILLSNPIQEYVTGLVTFASSVYAFKTDFYRKQVSNTEKVHILNPNDFPTPIERAKFVDDHGICLLYAQGARALIDMVKIRRLTRNKPRLIVTCHSPALWASRVRSFMFVLYACLFSDGMVFLVERYRRKWLWLTRLFGLRTWHVPNPVDVSRFKPRDERWTKGGSIVLGCIGTITPRKRQDLLIEMLKGVRQAGFDARLCMAGECADQDFLRKLKLMIAKNHLEEYVRFDGRIPYDDVPEWFKKIDVYVCPSDDEVMPFSILEAMTMQLPVIAHDIAGIHEEVHDGVNGVLVPTTCAEDYLKAFLTVADRYHEFSSEAAKLIGDNFTTAVFGERMALITRGG